MPRLLPADVTSNDIKKHTSVPHFLVDRVIAATRHALLDPNDGLMHTQNGARCPCCDKTVKAYRRKINANVAHFMIWLTAQAQRGDGGWLDIKNYRSRGGDYGKARHWGLAATTQEHTDETKNSGLWKPTIRGMQWALGQTSVPSYAILYNNELLSLDSSDGRSTIHDALSTKFSYSALVIETGLQAQ